MLLGKGWPGGQPASRAAGETVHEPQRQKSQQDIKDGKRPPALPLAAQV
jgi:hypothetical protein